MAFLSVFSLLVCPYGQSVHKLCVQLLKKNFYYRKANSTREDWITYAICSEKLPYAHKKALPKNSLLGKSFTCLLTIFSSFGEHYRVKIEVFVCLAQPFLMDILV